MSRVAEISPRKIWRWRPSTLSCVLVAIGPLIYGLSILSVALFSDLTSFAWKEKGHELWRPLRYSAWISCLTCMVCAFVSPLVAGSFYYLQRRVLALRNQALIQWMLLPYCLPTVVVGGMMILAFGNAGLVNHLWALLHDADVAPVKFLYLDATPLLGTVWMNLSFGVLLLLKQWHRIPGVLWFQADNFQLSLWKKFHAIVMPYTLAVFLPWLLLVFLSCFSSFGLMLMLSGSPRATTLELATWQSLFLEGDWSKAAALMLIQMVSSFALVLSVMLLTKTRTLSSVNELGFERDVDESLDVSAGPQTESKSLAITRTAIASAVVGLFILFYVTPVLALLKECYSSLQPSSHSIQWDILWQASWQSLQNGLGAALITASIVFILVANERRALYFARPRVATWLQISTFLPLVVPGMCVSFGLMALTYNWDWEVGKRLGVWLIQALCALPVAVALFRFGWNQDMASSAGVRDELGMGAWNYFLAVEWSAMRRWLMLVTILTLVLSLSDVTVVSLLSDPGEPVLTVVIAQLMGSYQFSEASLASGLLLLLAMAGLILLSASTSLKFTKDQEEN